jgi:peptidoglycan/LPS O-acetylase OafA/YrhL
MVARAERFPLMDSLRAIAALAVLTTHASFVAGLSNAPGSTLRPYTARLDVGVAVFFLISGFLLYRPFVKARLDGEPSPATLPYAWRRFLRIVPAYWVALTVIALWVGPRDVFHPDRALVYYGFGQIYNGYDVLGGLAQAWTLCVEVTFYAALPLWACAMRSLPARSRGTRVRQEAIALMLLFAAGLAYKLIALSGPGDPTGPEQFILPNFLDQFALGMGLAVASVWLAGRRSPAPLRAIERFPALAWAGALAAFWAVSTQIGLTGLVGERIDETRFIERHYLYAAVGFFLLLPAIVGEPRRGLVRRLLANRMLAWLGLISYSIYLWHQAVFTQLDRWGLGSVGFPSHFVLWWLVGLAFTVPIAAASHYLVERPALSLKRLLPDRTRAIAGEAIAEPAGPVRAPALVAGGGPGEPGPA